MKKLLQMLPIAILLSVVGCIVDPPPPPPLSVENWDFPAGGTGPALAPMATKDTVAVGDPFEVKFVGYQLNTFYAVTLKVPYDHRVLRIEKVLAGPLSGQGDAVSVGIADSNLDEIRFACTYHDVSKASQGEGVLFKIKGTAVGRGTNHLRVDETMVSFYDREGVELQGRAGKIDRRTDVIVVR